MEGEHVSKTFRHTDSASLGAAFAWIPIFGVPAAIAWRQEWRIAMWVLIALTVVSLFFFVVEILERNSTKWRATLDFERWPVPLGYGPEPRLVVEAFKHPPEDTSLKILVQITCKETYQRSSDHDLGAKLEETVVNLEEEYELPLRSGRAELMLPYKLGLDAGAPTQEDRFRHAANNDGYDLYRIKWEMRVEVEPIGIKLMNDELKVGSYVMEGAA